MTITERDKVSLRVLLAICVIIVLLAFIVGATGCLGPGR